MSQSDHQLAAIMFTDIVGYTTLMGEDEQMAMDLLKVNRDIQKPLVESYNGRWHKEMGDGTLVSFPTASEAVYCAIKIQEKLKDNNKLHLRIGIHLGEIILEDHDVFGDGVNIASRLERITPTGKIWISETVYQNIQNKKGIDAKLVGEEILKNVKDPVRVYEVNAEVENIPITQIGKSANLHNTKHANPVGSLFGKASLINKPVLIIMIAISSLAVGYYFIQKDSIPIDQEKSIAILPLTSLSTDPENQFFADGVVEDLLNRLSLMKDFKVISRTSSDKYRERGTKTVPEIARELGVSYIIEGSIQRINNTVRINIQLIDGKRDAHIWSRLYDRKLIDIFETQSEIALKVASELNAVLTGQQTEDIRRNRTQNIDAFELYRIGRIHWNERTRDGYLKSIDYFKQAITEDSTYGLAYAGMADTYNLMALQGYMDEKEGRDKAVELSLIALDLDERLAEAHNVLASIYTYIDFDWDAADKEYKLAIETNQNYSTAYHYYSEYLSILGLHDLARVQINKAIELDPLSFVIRYVSMKLHYNRGQFQEALIDLQRCKELYQNEDHHWIALYEFQINWALGNESQALNGLKRYWVNFQELVDGNEFDTVYENFGIKGIFELVIKLSDSPWIKAQYYAHLYDEENAVFWLEEAVKQRKSTIEFAFYRIFEILHLNPRYVKLLQQLGLVKA